MDFRQALAYAAASDALCLFTGAGFSKNLSGGSAPDWNELLEASCESLNDSAHAKSQLEQARGTYSLEDCAQILELAFLREGKDFRQALSEQIDRIPSSRENETTLRRFLSENRSTTVVTTNYDQLVEKCLAGEVPFVTHYAGKPIARKSDAVQIFHIHGSTESPPSLIATTSDYYRFINEGNYFAQKMLTLLHESSVIILGYNLGDTNLKSILSRLKSHGMRSISRGNIFYVTRGVVPAYVRDYYEAAYGLVVIENMEIDALLGQVMAEIPDARAYITQAEQDLRDVLAGKKSWTDQFLKLQAALFKILASANVHGVNTSSEQFVTMLTTVLQKKRQFSAQNGAWDQYSHLADWLIHIGSIIEVRGRRLEAVYLEAVRHSMQSMSSSYIRGKSWYAFSVWNEKWKYISFDNRMLISAFVERTLQDSADALRIVRQ